MAIKQFTFSFKLDAKDLFEFIAERNVAMSIDAYGTPSKKPKPQLSAPAPMLALPAPRNGKRPTIKSLVLAYFAANPDAKASMSILRDLSIQAGHSPSSTHGQVWLMRQEGTVKAAGRGFYRATVKGLREAQNAQENA